MRSIVAVCRYQPLWLNLPALCIVIGASLWSGWQLTQVHGDTLVDQSRSDLFILRPSVLFAAGQGLGKRACDTGEFPELDAFLNQEIASIPRHTYPQHCEHPYGRDYLFYFHYYLIAFMGWMFRLFGVSIGVYYVACIMLHVAAMMIVYCLFRTVMSALFAVPGTVYLAVSPAWLIQLPSLRDFGKAPFILAAILMMSILIKRPRSPRRFVAFSGLLGLLIGVGYGFRQDVFICLPPAILVVLFGEIAGGRHRLRARIIALMLLIFAFALAATPVLRGKHMAGDFLTYHVLLTGLTEGAEKTVGVGDSAYHFGFLGLDTPISASVAAYAQRVGSEYPVVCFTPAYGVVARNLFMDIAQRFPADLATRALSTLYHMFGIHNDPYVDMVLAASPYNSVAPLPVTVFTQARSRINSFISSTSALWAVVLCCAMAARSRKKALLLLLLVGYFGAYPALLLEYRHYFHLAFLPLLATGAFLSLIVNFALSGQGPDPLDSRGMYRGVVFCLILIVTGTASLSVLRVSQSYQVRRMADAIAAMPVTPVKTTVIRDGHRAFVKLDQTILEQLGGAPLSEGHVASAYLVARFSHPDRTISFTLSNDNPSFVTPCHLVLSGSAGYYFPVYDFGAEPDAIFRGIELAWADVPFFEGLYRVEGAEQTRLWPHLALNDNRAHFYTVKHGPIDRFAAVLLAEVRSVFGLFPGPSLDAYQRLMRRYPYHKPLAKNALLHAGHLGDSALLQTWASIGARMPDMRFDAATWLAKRGEDALKERHYADALGVFENALSVVPADLWHLVRIGEIYESTGDLEAAINAYRTVLLRAPESPITAQKFYELLRLHTIVGTRVLSEWKEIQDIHPNSPLVWLYVGIAFETLGRYADASHAYGQSLTYKPDYPEALLHLGAMNVRQGKLDAGLRMMEQAAFLDAELTRSVAQKCEELAEYFRQEQRFDLALILYQAALDVSPSDLWPRVGIGEMHETLGELECAIEQYRVVLLEAPDSPLSAKRLDALLRLAHSESKYIADYWRAIADANPHSSIPERYLEKYIDR